MSKHTNLAAVELGEMEKSCERVSPSRILEQEKKALQKEEVFMQEQGHLSKQCT